MQATIKLYTCTQPQNTPPTRNQKMSGYWLYFILTSGLSNKQTYFDCAQANHLMVAQKHNIFWLHVSNVIMALMAFHIGFQTPAKIGLAHII